MCNILNHFGFTQFKADHVYTLMLLDSIPEYFKDPNLCISPTVPYLFKYMNMEAFVDVIAVRASSDILPRGDLDAVCALSKRSTKAVWNVRKHRLAHMTVANPSITLDALVYNPTPIVSGVEDKDIICYRVWKQVFGNAYIMESEREEAYEAESMFRAGRIPLREFVRAVALTATYRRRFFECCGPYRTVELNFKHLLGRSPVSQRELSEHVQRIANEGFVAEVNSYIDSSEYEEAFGDDVVPYMRFKGTYSSCSEFNRTCAMYSALGTTDKSLTRRARQLDIPNPNHVLSLDGAGYASKTVSSIASNTPTNFISVTKGIPTRPDLDFRYEQSPFTKRVPVNANSNSVSRVEIAPGNYIYLNNEDAEEFKRFNFEQENIKSYARAEIMEAERQIELLKSKITELKTIL